MNIENIYNKKDLIGKILFSLSIIILAYMFITPLSKVIIHVDESFTVGLLRLPFVDFWNTILVDVHPPLYYLILRTVNELLIFFNMSSSSYIYVYKIVSIVPYILILIISLTFLRKKYDWFTSGLFVFTLCTCSEFFRNYLTIRMYSWGILFLLMMFIAYTELIDKYDIKSWSLFTIFAILCVYTHNILLISVGLLYLFVLINIYLKNRKQIKNFLISAVITVICYIPWLFVLLNQVASRSSNVPIPSLTDIFNYVLFYALYDTSFSLEFIIFKVLAFILLIMVIYYSYKTFKNNESLDKISVFSGILLYFLGLIFSVILLFFTFKQLAVRYVLPIISVLWLSISILLYNIKDKRIWLVITIIILVLSSVNFVDTCILSDELYDNGITETSSFEKMNNNNSVVIYTNRLQYISYHDYLNNSKEYATSKFNIPYETTYEQSDNLKEILQNNPDKDVYIIKQVNSKKDRTFGKGISYKKVSNRGRTWIIKLKLKDSDNQK